MYTHLKPQTILIKVYTIYYTNMWVFLCKIMKKIHTNINVTNSITNPNFATFFKKLIEVIDGIIF